MFARAAREPRVIAGIVLVVAAIAVGLSSLHRDTAQADRDYAYCMSAHPDCSTQRKPASVVTTRSSDNGFHKQYSLDIQTGSHTTLTLDGLTAQQAAAFAQQPNAAVRYRGGHPTAVIAADGTALEVPFVFSTRLLAAVGAAAALFLAGAGSLAWGLTRVNRTPKTA